MHKSRLAGLIIDCRTDDPKPAAAFWSGALGMEAREVPGDQGQRYVQLVGRDDRWYFAVQSVSHESRVHLDIETDDVEAEVLRLERLGARKVEKVNSWWVMEAPTGQRFCVVKAVSSTFAAEAHVWE